MIHPISGSLAASISNPAEHSSSRADATSADGRATRVQIDGPHSTDNQTDSKPAADALQQANEQLQAWSTGMRFSVDDDAQRLVVSIVDNGTGEVLRTVPSEAVLKIARMIVQFQGAGVDTQV
ncbi:MAG: flagellar protein FlaG [Alcaligenaceae bacterium]|nr:flagellar protein FlaG [Alcaligenaceae bacterium]